MSQHILMRFFVKEKCRVNQKLIATRLVEHADSA
jgi:hypothetical protein